MASSTNIPPPNGKEMDMADADVLDNDDWKRMQKIFDRILKNALNTDNIQQRAEFMYIAIKESDFFAGFDVFTAEMLNALTPDAIEIGFKKSKEKHGRGNVTDGRPCHELSEDVFGFKLNEDAWKLIPNLTPAIVANDDGNVNDADDTFEFADGEDEDNDKETKIRKYINMLPTSTDLISKDVQTAQQAFFAKIKALYDKSPSMPNKSDRQKQDWKDWISEVSTEQLKMNNQMGTKILPWGHIPLSVLADLWSKSKRSDITDQDRKEMREMMLGLWVSHQFPVGWTKMPPEEINTYPNQKQLESAITVRLKYQQKLEKEQAIKRAGKMVPASNTNNTTALGSTAGAGPGQVANAAAGAYVHTAIHGPLVDRTVTGPNEKRELFLPSGRVEAGKLTVNSNKTEDGEPVVAWYNRKTVYKDDDDPQHKQAKQEFFYFIVQKNSTRWGQLTTFYEVVGEELCGGREMRKAVNQDQVPRVLEQEKLKDLPTRKQITEIEWGLEWCAVARKYRDKKGLPIMFVCMWWKVEKNDDFDQFKIKLDPEKLDQERRAKERRVVLARGHFTTLLGPRGDKMIMKSIPHPQGMVWSGVKECIQAFLQIVQV